MKIAEISFSQNSINF